MTYEEALLRLELPPEDNPESWYKAFQLAKSALSKLAELDYIIHYPSQDDAIILKYAEMCGVITR